MKKIENPESNSIVKVSLLTEGKTKLLSITYKSKPNKEYLFKIDGEEYIESFWNFLELINSNRGSETVPNEIRNLSKELFDCELTLISQSKGVISLGTTINSLTSFAESKLLFYKVNPKIEIKLHKRCDKYSK